MAEYSPEFFGSVQAASSGSAERLLPVVFDLVMPQTVVDIGCGTGGWLAVAKKLGATRVLGVDGAYVQTDQLLIDPSEFLARDLAGDLDVSGTFDLVISLEVAEHLPPDRAGAFVKTLTSLGDIVLFSAAVPGQSGEGHVNEQWPAFWAECFEREGFSQIDCVRERVWDDPGVIWWYAQNCFLYARHDTLERRPDLQAARSHSGFAGKSIVHPDTFTYFIDAWQQRAATVTETADGIPGRRLVRILLGRALRRRHPPASLG